MKNGSYSTGEQNVIRFKCTNCEFIDAMDCNIAEEVLDVKKYKGQRVYYAYCIKCDHIMYPLELMDLDN